MPARRRVTKRRTSEREIAQKWEQVFESGVDYFHDLLEFGLETPADVIAAARLAWARYGVHYLANRPECFREQPWALENFGRP